MRVSSLTQRALPTVSKAWGREEWIVNEPEYCCKLLYLDKDAYSSLHFHNIKKETFLVLSGKVELENEDHSLLLDEESEPVTINPGQKHRFTGIEGSVILEVSTHHDDNDVVRTTLSGRAS